jgi:hypothetical protein
MIVVDTNSRSILFTLSLRSPALAIDESYDKARLRRARCFIASGAFESGIRDLRQILRSSPEREDISIEIEEAQASFDAWKQELKAEKERERVREERNRKKKEEEARAKREKKFPSGGQCPPRKTEADFYSLLGVSRIAHVNEIKKAFHKLALKYHPDKNGDGGAEEMFKKINEAYQTLSDESLRNSYDINLSYRFR